MKKQPKKKTAPKKNSKPKGKKPTRARSAKSGQFVDKKFAKRHPHTTVEEEID